MRRTFIAVVGVALGLGAGLGADGGRWWAHVRFLADDSLEGRETGTVGYSRAAEYVARGFERQGLEPLGAPGFFQPVAFSVGRIDERQSRLVLVRNAETDRLTLGEDAMLGVRIDSPSTVDAPLVFVGHGLDIPDEQINDLDGLDLRGAVAVYFTPTPASLSGPLRAHFGSAAERWRMLRARGAIGTVAIAHPDTLEIPWSRSASRRLQPQLTLADGTLNEYAGRRLAVTMNPAHTDKLFAGSGHTFREIVMLEDAGRPLPRFALPARIMATTTARRSQVESPNVVGLLRGTDPDRRGQYVVLSAHLDHLGIGEPDPARPADRIYNGAMDNASGVAAILEVAAELHESGERPARSILFVALAGEEEGELGSRYFIAHPPVPPGSIVANVNTDMFLPLFPLNQLMVLGLDESDLGSEVRRVAAALNLRVQADPEPQRNRFVRSDQYSFVRAGIPALAMKVGYDANSPEAAIAAKWTAERYHAPSDDANQPVDVTAAARFVDVLRLLALRVANASDRPKWNDNSFFKRFSQ